MLLVKLGLCRSASPHNNRQRKTEIAEQAKESRDWATYKRLLSYVAPYWYILTFAIIGFMAAAGADAFFVRLLGDLIDNWNPESSDNIALIPWTMAGVGTWRSRRPSRIRRPSCRLVGCNLDISR